MIRLNIKWSGNVPGIAEHRLSVQHFGTPLRHLLMAVRRTANNILRQAYLRKESDLGRLASEADLIDLQIAGVYESSLGVGSIVDVQMPPGQMPLMPEQLAGDALDRFLADMEKESNGVRRNNGARRFLLSLPPGLTSQEYRLYINDEERRVVTLGELSIPVSVDSLPFLLELTGDVIGVGFDPGRHVVRIKASDVSGSETTFQATAEQVNLALEYRDSPVRVLALSGMGTKRLLRIQRDDEPRVRLDRDDYVFKKWDPALAELAR